MSNATGQARFSNGEIMFFIYRGTYDRADSDLYPSREEAWDNWERGHDLSHTSHEEEDVDIATDYGDGITWQGKACRLCNKIVAGHEPNEFGYDEEDDELWGYYSPVKFQIWNPRDGLPDWWSTSRRSPPPSIAGKERTRYPRLGQRELTGIKGFRAPDTLKIILPKLGGSGQDESRSI